MKKRVERQFKSGCGTNSECRLISNLICSTEYKCNQCNVPIIVLLKKVLDTDRMIGLLDDDSDLKIIADIQKDPNWRDKCKDWDEFQEFLKAEDRALDEWQEGHDFQWSEE